jgi:hypothetical protein
MDGVTRLDEPFIGLDVHLKYLLTVIRKIAAGAQLDEAMSVQDARRPGLGYRRPRV